MQYDQGSAYVRDFGGLSVAEERAGFMRRVYTNLCVSLALFVGLEAYLQKAVDQEAVLKLFLGGKFNWLVVLGVYMALGWLAKTLVANQASRPVQYAGLGLGILAESAIFMPLIYLATKQDPSGTLLVNAGLMTGLLFAGLVATVIMTGKNFSFLKTAVTIGTFVALGAIVLSIIMGISLGFWFAVAMVVLLSAVILYQTSVIYRDFPGNMEVPAALMLFTSFTTLLWYVIQILMSRRD